MIFSDIVYGETITLFSIAFVIALMALFYEWHFRIRFARIHLLERILIRLTSERISDYAPYIPKKLFHLVYLVPALETIDKFTSGVFWETFKEQLLHLEMGEQIQSFITSRTLVKKGLALRALKLVPRRRYESHVISLLQDKKSFIRFLAISCALRLGTRRALRALLKQMGKEPPTMQYPYRDALIASDEETYHMLRAFYLESEDQQEKLSCLKVLALKSGYLVYDDLKEALEKKEMPLYWWALRALQSCPSKEGVEKLFEASRDPDWAVRAIALHSLGALDATKSTDLMIASLEDSVFWVRYAAALSLCFMGESSAATSAKQIVSYIKTQTEIARQKGIDDFFPTDYDQLIAIRM